MGEHKQTNDLSKIGEVISENFDEEDTQWSGIPGDEPVIKSERPKKVKKVKPTRTPQSYEEKEDMLNDPDMVEFKAMMEDKNIYGKKFPKRTGDF